MSGFALDCNANGIPDSCDLAAGAADCNGNLIPDLCELVSGSLPDCNNNGVPDVCDIASGFAQDCNGNAIPDSCDIALGTADANNNGVPDSCECSAVNYCIPLPNSTGDVALIGMSGLPSLSINNATLTCAQLPQPTVGLFFFGTAQNLPGTPFGNGRLCIGGTIKRLPTVSTSTGFASQLQNFQSGPYGGVQAGGTRYFQFWYRDVSAGGAGFNASDALRVTFCQ